MRKPILSIVIPVYNVEDYLVECYDSVVGSDSTENIEIILVDDGSTDGSGKICDDLSENFGTLVLHKENGGLASARNYGMSRASGRYITFIDSDDRIESASLSKVVNYIAEIDKDIIFLNISKFFEDGSVVDMGDSVSREKITDTNKADCIDYLSTRPKFPASACAKIYKKDFLKKHNISFPDDGRLSEDMGFSFKCILCANSFDKIDLPFYYYRQNRKDSITSKVTIRNFVGLSQFIIDSVDAYTDNGRPKSGEIKKMFSFLAYEYSILLWFYNFLSSRDKRHAFSFLKKYKFVMKWARSRRTIVIGKILNTFGIRVTSRLLFLIRGAK